MRAHIITGITAAAAAIVGSIGLQRATAPKPQPAVTQTVNVSKHAWPDLSEAETIALGESLASLKDTKIHIVCNDAACSDLAHDLDNAFEIAGMTSALDKSVFPLGYGLAIGADPGDARAEQVVRAIAMATNNRIAPKVEYGEQGGVLIVAIGKKPAGK